MDETWTTLGLAVVLFVSTNIDDVFLLLALFSDPRVHPAAVVAGQFLGMLALVLGTVAVSALALAVAPAYVGLLGVFPLGIGVVQLVRRARGDDDDAPAVTRSGMAAQILAVTLITVANGGDNLAVYVPAFATREPLDILLLGASFLVLTGGWCWLGYLLVSHPRLGAPIRRFAAPAAPWVLIALGLFILIDGKAHRVFS